MKINEILEKYYMPDVSLEKEYNRCNNIEELITYIYKGMTGYNDGDSIKYCQSWLDYRNIEKLVYYYLVNMYNKTKEMNAFCKKEYYSNMSKYTFDREDEYLYRDSIRKEYCRVYLPFDRKQYVQNFKQVSKIIEIMKKYNENYITGYWFRMEPTNEGITIGLNSREAYYLFISILSQKPEITERLGKSNLFIPSVAKVGVMPGNSNTYIKFVTNTLTRYIYNCVSSNKEANLDGFKNYIIRLKSTNYGHDINLDNYFDIILGKINGVPDRILISQILDRNIDLGKLTEETHNRNISAKKIKR